MEASHLIWIMALVVNMLQIIFAPLTFGAWGRAIVVTLTVLFAFVLGYDAGIYTEGLKP